MVERCDICGIESDFLADYYVKICQDCKRKHTDVVLLKRIGFLLNFLEAKKTETGVD